MISLVTDVACTAGPSLPDEPEYVIASVADGCCLQEPGSCSVGALLAAQQGEANARSNSLLSYWVVWAGFATPTMSFRHPQRSLAVQTDVPLQCKDTMPQAATPQMAAPSLGGLATPLLFSSSRGSMRPRVGSGSWSPSINLEKIGQHLLIGLDWI